MNVIFMGHIKAYYLTLIALRLQSSFFIFQFIVYNYGLNRFRKCRLITDAFICALAHLMGARGLISGRAPHQ